MVVYPPLAASSSGCRFAEVVTVLTTGGAKGIVLNLFRLVLGIRYYNGND